MYIYIYMDELDLVCLPYNNYNYKYIDIDIHIDR